YRLTEKGLDLYPVIIGLRGWGDRWFGEGHDTPVRLFHKRCGHETTPALTCSACGERLDARAVRPLLDTEGRDHARPRRRRRYTPRSRSTPFPSRRRTSPRSASCAATTAGCVSTWSMAASRACALTSRTPSRTATCATRGSPSRTTPITRSA